MRALVEEGTKPGLLAFDRAHAVGWISVARRESYGQLVRSRQYAPRDDDEQVWSIVCLYVHAAERRRRIASLMLDSAIAWAFDAGADAIEVYPATVASRSDYMGAIAGYRKRGFVPVREAGTRTIMRLARYATSP
jgi:GNAT superfamily N-acetyltransferase